MSDRCIVFLDFDGVLHPQGCVPLQRFCHLDLFEGRLRQNSDVDLVISSSWRLSNDLAALKSIFSEDLQSRVLGTTPAGPDRGGAREHQIWQWLLNSQPTARWVAFDDSEWLFSSTQRLVLCDSDHGLRASDLLEADRLLAFPAELAPPARQTQRSSFTKLP